MPRRVVLYARISKDRGGAGLGVERQLADCRDLATSLAWNVVGERTDNDVSAYSGKRRPGYEGLLEDLRGGKADAVIAWHPDRLHRRPLELEEFISVCEERSVAVRTVRAGEVDLGTPSGRAIARTLGAWARHEVEHMIARQKAAKAQAAEAGRFLGGRRAFGFESDGRTANPVEAKIVRELCSRVIAGESLGSLARELNDRGVRGTFGALWTGAALHHVLLRPRNAGLSFHLGERVGTATWDPIVDEETWTTVRAILTAPGRTAVKSAPRRWLGSGLYVCGVCGAPVRITSTGKNRHRVNPNSYRCSTEKVHVYRVADAVDKLVVDLILAYLPTVDLEELAPAGQLREDVGELLERAKGIDAQLDEVMDMFDKGEIVRSQVAERTRRLTERRDAIEARIGELSIPDVLHGLVGDDVPDAAAAVAAWGRVSLERKRAVLDLLLQVRILPSSRGRKPGGGYFDPKSVDIQWKPQD